MRGELPGEGVIPVFFSYLSLFLVVSLFNTPIFCEDSPDQVFHSCWLFPQVTHVLDVRHQPPPDGTLPLQSKTPLSVFSFVCNSWKFFSDALEPGRIPCTSGGDDPCDNPLRHPPADYDCPSITTQVQRLIFLPRSPLTRRPPEGGGVPLGLLPPRSVILIPMGFGGPQFRNLDSPSPLSRHDRMRGAASRSAKASPFLPPHSPFLCAFPKLPRKGGLSHPPPLHRRLGGEPSV